MAGKKKDVAANAPKWEDVSAIPREEQPWPLPEGWKWIRLLHSFYNKTDSRKKLPQKYYSINGKFAVIDQGKELIGGYSDNEDLVYNGDLPVIIFGDHTRCIKFIDFKFIQGADGIKVLLPKKDIFPKYLFYALQNIQFPDLGYRRHFPIFKDFFIPVAPIETQQRIVTIIESLFSKLNEAAKKVQAVIDGHEARKQAILYKAFSGELTKKWREEYGVSFDSWGERTVDEISEFIKAGGDKPDDFQETEDDIHNIPVIANGIENNGVIGYTSFSKNYKNTLTVAGRGTIGFPCLRDYDYFPVVRLRGHPIIKMGKF